MSSSIIEEFLKNIERQKERELKIFREQQQQKYHNLVVSYIRQKYSSDDEFAILRQRESNAEEFEEYYNYCEECKAKARALVFGE